MSLISNYGLPSNPIWIILNAPYGKPVVYGQDAQGNNVITSVATGDAVDGVLLSGGYGHNFKRIWKHAGLSLNDTFMLSLRPCLGASYLTDSVHSNLLADLDKYRPPIIVPLSDEILNYLVPETQQAKEKNSSLLKWAGSLLQSKYLSYPHYVIGSHDPEWVTRNWAYNEIQATIDFGHVKEEFDYWRQYGTINPLPKRSLIVEPTYPDLVGYLSSCLSCQMVSVDIETIRPKEGSFYHKVNCGYPYTIAIAKSPWDAMSFSFWDYTEDQSLVIWRVLGKILSTIPQIGQNYFLFDSHYHEALGFKVCLELCHDTMIRHHILHPSLKHALHFQTRQYTREPYYKDEGKNFNPKFKKKFMIYNAKDAAVTFEIYEQQELEFNDRPYLR